MITWRLPDGGPKPGFVRQDLYLYAEGGPLTYTAPDQAVPGGGRTTGGWFRTPTALQPTWEELGLPTQSAPEGVASAPKSATPPAKDVAPARETAPASDPSRGLARWPAVAVVAAVALAVIASRVTLGRRVRVGST